ncbi:MAG: UDP-N-acetylglucosamine 2-epimerase, partial [Saprospiraceae bacterium]|nr:UDP-N-acetylglucosamine 2-epimerase [Saprospiraceae bacterium]
MTFAIIAGARPNFIKAVPLYRALRAYPGVRVELIHTGQHPDAHMSSDLALELGLSAPWITLPGQESSPLRETARVLQQLEPVLQGLSPDWVIVIGDVNSTLAGALAARQLGLRLAHVEAGLRSGDRTMPEETNR